MKRIFITTISSLTLLPLVTSAQLNDTQGLIQAVMDIVQMLITLVAAISLLAFMWGLAKFIFKAGDEKAIESGKNLMKWGLIALFVMVSVWGIIGFFQSELGLQGVSSPIQNNNSISI